ncbi:hypothetical protein ACQPZA_02595 [Pseudonocardia xinjiangensis]|uniref:hypothetical protein n=1 Tax=Pseudonocardia xinjiangensis TaxID=75289 RepID=UPI003D914BC1
MQRIAADLMIPGRGDPVADAVVLLDGPTISYAGPAAEAPEAPGAETVRTAVVMPGYDADVLTLDHDPLDDITVLADPEQVRGVWQAGRRVKG